MFKDTIRLKKKKIIPETPGYTTLITAVKLIDCEESKALPVNETLDRGIGVQHDGKKHGKNILAYTVCGNTDCALADGIAVNADFVVFSTLVKTKKSDMKSLGDTGEDQYIAKRVTGTIYILEIKLLDTASGKVLISLKRSAGNPDSLKNITDEFIKKTAKYYQRDK